ncbi:MAG: response regulator [Flavobacteriales bacterium]|nr:response regulator [Flavobacteriales bacterium]
MSTKILLADDHPLILKGTKEFLNEIGFKNVLTSEDGLEAYKLVLKEKPDVLILDYNIPKLDGLELAKLFDKEGIEVKIILLTLQKNELILKEVGETIDAYLLKEDALDKLKCA